MKIRALVHGADMDRDALKKWLSTPCKTWRWNFGDKTKYYAGEATDEKVEIFAWSHEYDEGGKNRVLELSATEFLARDQVEFMPDAIKTTIDAWIRENRK